jgi:hypothetical protein
LVRQAFYGQNQGDFDLKIDKDHVQVKKKTSSQNLGAVSGSDLWLLVR